MKNSKDFKKYKLCICYSGGIDSITAFFYAINELKYKLDDIYLLMIDYGQEYFQKEFFLFTKMAELFNGKINYRVLSVNIDNESDVEYHYTLNRNVIISSIAFRFSDEVWLVANADERHVRDKDLEFFNLSTNLNSHTIGKPVLLTSPFKNWSRKLILRWGVGNNVPYNLSTSCYHHELMQCGECKGCIDRYFDFMDLGIVENFCNDVLDYERTQNIVYHMMIKEKTPEENMILEKYIRVLNLTEKGKEILKCMK